MPDFTKHTRLEDLLRVNPQTVFRSLYEDHVEQVACYVARRTSANDVQDIVADTFLTAWRRLDHVPADDPLLGFCARPATRSEITSE